MSRKVTLSMLRARLRTRGRAKDRVFYLDLRHEDFGQLGRVTLHDPRHPKWPNKGRTTADEAEAKRWLEEKYLSWIRTRLATDPCGPVTTEEACDVYIAALTQKFGPDYNTVVNRRSVFNVHVKPALGALPLTSLDAPRVRPFLENLEVVRRKHGKVWKEPAGFRTRTNVRTALQALWNHFHEDIPAPFGQIRLENDDLRRRRIEARDRGDLFLDETPSTYSPDEVLEILAHAMVYDRQVLSRPNLAVKTILNTAEVIAAQLGLATRIEELMPIRWGQILDDLGLVRIPGTKNDNAWRWAPIQDGVRPWIERLRTYSANPAPSDYLVRTDPRPSGKGRKPSGSTYQSRVERVLTRAGLKYPRKLTHIFRATHITWATGNGYPDDRLKRWVGHADPKEGATGLYRDPDKLARMLTVRDRTYLVGLPTPEECEERAREIMRGPK